MAEISAALSIISNISNTLSDIQEKIYNIEPIIKQAFDVTIVRDINNNLYQTANNMLNIGNMVVNVSNQLETAEKKTEKAAKKGDLLSSAYKKVAAAVKNIDVKDVLNKSDELTQTMSRLNNINDGSKSTSELFDMIYASAKDANAPLMSTADAIITMGNSTGDLFGSNQELVDFMNQVNKQFAIGGASATEQSSALDQLSQSMASGVIKGSEMNKILEAAPGIASTIEKNMGWAEGSLMSYADQGKVTAEVVKASLLNMSDETNRAFEDIPLTFSQVVTNLQSDTTKIFQPVLQKINEAFNSEIFQSFLVGVTTAMTVGSNIIITVFDLFGSIASLVYDNWSMIEPLIHGVIAALAVYIGYLGIVKVVEMVGNAIKAISCLASLAHAAATREEVDETLKATAAQYGFNAALLASPITWIVIILALVIAAVIAFASWIAKTTGVAQTGFGVIAGAVGVLATVIVNILIGLANFILTMLVNLANVTSNFTAGLKLLFVNPIAGIKVMFLSLFDFIVGIVEGAASILDAIFGSSLAEAVADFRNGIQTEIDTTLEANGIESEIFSTSDIRLDRFDYGDSWDKFSAWGDEVANNWGDIGDTTFDPQNYGIPDDTQNDIAATADNTASLNDSVDISNENLKYLKDVAERDAINRFTTAQIKVNMNNNNNISSGMDLDGIINYLTTGVTDAMGQAAEGVHT